MELANNPGILVASRDPELADVRKSVLERAGFLVFTACDTASVKKTCNEGKVGLVMLGYSLPPSEKRRIWKAAREHCKVPILELYRKGSPELVDQYVFHHEAQTTDDFLEVVRKITSGTPS